MSMFNFAEYDEPANDTGAEQYQPTLADSMSAVRFVEALEYFDIDRGEAACTVCMAPTLRAVVQAIRTGSTWYEACEEANVRAVTQWDLVLRSDPLPDNCTACGKPVVDVEDCTNAGTDRGACDWFDAGLSAGGWTCETHDGGHWN